MAGLLKNVMKSRKIAEVGIAALFSFALMTGSAAPMPDNSAAEQAAVAAAQTTDCYREARPGELKVQRTIKVFSKRSDANSLSADEMHEYLMSACLALHGAIALAKQQGAAVSGHLADIPFVLQDTVNGAPDNALYDTPGRVVRVGAAIKTQMDMLNFEGMSSTGIPLGSRTRAGTCGNGTLRSARIYKVCRHRVNRGGGDFRLVVCEPTI